MRHLLAIAIVGLTVIAPKTWAQVDLGQRGFNNPAILNEAQKRRLFLPYVRASTDCFAAYARNRSDLLITYEQGRLRAILADGLQFCSAPLSNMRTQHDRIYGYGTGQVFITGPYFSDLERAVLVRLKVQLERLKIAAQQERQRQFEKEASARQERERRAEILLASGKVLYNRAYECINSNLTQLLASDEKAEVITEVAMTICSQQVAQAIEGTNLFLAAKDNGFKSNPSTDAEVRKVIRDQVLASAVQKRAERNSGNKPAAIQSSSPDVTLQSCLKGSLALRKDRIVERQKMVSMMLELCRPEIEGSARSAFLANPSIGLDNARAASLKEAKAISERLAND